MPNPVSLMQQLKQPLTQRQAQRLIMSGHMQQALNLLQMPVTELATTIETEMEQNPVLEYAIEESEDETGEGDELSLDADHELEKPLDFSDTNFEVLRRLDREFQDKFLDGAAKDKSKEYRESLICEKISLFDYLMRQARDTFDNLRDLDLAESLIGNFDESGFLTTPLSEIAILVRADQEELKTILSTIQTFEPRGVGATSLKECLLIQLKRQGRQKSLAYRVINEQYDNLLHNHILEIQKKLRCTMKDLQRAIYEEIGKLDFHPGSSYSQEDSVPIVPDVSIVERDGHLVVMIHDEEFLPNVRLNPEYVRMMEEKALSEETREFIRRKILSAKWLLRNIDHRGNTVQRIAHALLKRHSDFFMNPSGRLVPLTMLELADELDMHESTIARAVANKYINTPRGLFSLRFFFTSALDSDNGDVSSNTIRDIIKEMIAKEDKKNPLSDNDIAKELRGKGIACARRTIAKYRGQLKLGNAHQRRQYGI